MKRADEQLSIGNEKWFEKFGNKIKGVLNVDHDLEQLHNRRSMPQAWNPKKISSAIFYKSIN